MQFWEDFNVGKTCKFGTVTVSREDIIIFARQYDPRPFHVNEDAARRHRFGGLVASGLHTTAVGMRLLVDHILTDSTSLGSPGVKRLRWPHPVRPGDRLHVRSTCKKKRRPTPAPRWAASAISWKCSIRMSARCSASPRLNWRHTEKNE